MPQHYFTPLDADTDDGTKLVTELNLWIQAVVSQNCGTTRPTYVQQGTLWVDNSGSPELIVNLFDGVFDREMFRVSPSGVVTSGEQATVWSEIIPGHNFASCIGVYHNGTSWVRAIASSEATLAQAMVRSVSGTRVTFQSHGVFEGTDGLTPGAPYWLSSTSPGALTEVRPTSGYMQMIMVALASDRALVSVQPAQSVGGVVLLRPKPGENIIQGTTPDNWPLYLMRRADQRAGLLALLNENGVGIGGIDKDGLPWGTMAVTQAQQIPPGAFMHWMGTSPPNGWLLCNGGAISTSYPVLRSIFGTNMPDYQSRFVINASGSFPVGVGGGAYSVALTPGNLPHQLQLATSVGLADAGVKGKLTVNANEDAVSVNLTNTTFRGSSDLFSIVPSYIALTLICKAG